MQFVHKIDGLWEMKSTVPPSEVYVSSDEGFSKDEEYENQDVEERGTENKNVTAIPSNDDVGATTVTNSRS